MRNNRSLREFRNELIKNRAKSVAARRKKVNQRIVKKRNEFSNNSDSSEKTPVFQQSEVKDVRVGMYERRKRAIQKSRKRLRERQRVSGNIDYNSKFLPAAKGSSLKFSSYDLYQPVKHVNVAHVIDSSGMGGAQTMMMELVNGLNRYYGEHVTNHFIVVGSDSKIKKKFLSSYGIEAVGVAYNNLKRYCIEHQINVCLHHRTATAKPIKRQLPEAVKYILLNHTWNNMKKISQFYECDYFVSVCIFLHKKTKWERFIDESRKIVILNGVESDYIDDLPILDKLSGSFKIGRCHRLVGSKFRPDSLTWLAKKVVKIIPGLSHFLIGSNKDAKLLSKASPNLRYFGSIDDRSRKMAIIKQLDLYFYETFAHEGASMAILESLACGIPVMCFARGGNNELVVHGVNGFIVGDRSECMLFMQQMSGGKLAESLKKKTKEDFDKRLHVRHTACKYMQLFECAVNEE